MSMNRRVLSVFKIAITMILVALIIFGGVIIARNEAAAESIGTKVYTSINVDQGDSLWDIADRYCEDDSMIEAYIDEICEINGISITSTIITGNYLTVYYYK